MSAATPMQGTRIERCAARVSFALVSDFAGLDALGPEWAALFETAGLPHQVFQTFEWLAIWASLYVGNHMRLAIVTGRIDGRLAFVWPLVIQRVGGLRVLACMGEPLAQYGDALLAADFQAADQDAAYDYLMALPVDVIALRHVRDDAAIAPLLRRRLGPGANHQGAPFVDFAGVPDAAAFEARFPGKIRSSRRRRQRRLEERGAVTFTTCGPSMEAATLVAEALAFKREWATRQRVFSPALRDPRFERFFLAAARAERPCLDLRVSALRCADEVVGIALSIACKGSLFGHILAPRPSLDRLGLGGILAERTLLEARDCGFVAFDMLAPADDYKLEWADRTVGVADYAIGRSMFGRLYADFWIGWGRDAAKRLVSRGSDLIRKGRKAS